MRIPAWAWTMGKRKENIIAFTKILRSAADALALCGRRDINYGLLFFTAAAAAAVPAPALALSSMAAGSSSSPPRPGSAAPRGSQCRRTQSGPREPEWVSHKIGDFLKKSSKKKNRSWELILTKSFYQMI